MKRMFWIFIFFATILHSYSISAQENIQSPESPFIKYHFKVDIEYKRSYQLSILDWKDKIDSTEPNTYLGDASFNFSSETGRCIVIVYPDFLTDEKGRWVHDEDGELVTTGEISIHIDALLENGIYSGSSYHGMARFPGIVILYEHPVFIQDATEYINEHGKLPFAISRAPDGSMMWWEEVND